jgi:hypothetical protein
MPAFYNFDDETPDGPEDILGGDDAKQVQALRDWVLTLDNEAAKPPTPAPAAPAVQAAGEQAAEPIPGEAAGAVPN